MLCHLKGHLSNPCCIYTSSKSLCGYEELTVVSVDCSVWGHTLWAMGSRLDDTEILLLQGTNAEGRTTRAVLRTLSYCEEPLKWVEVLQVG